MADDENGLEERAVWSKASSFCSMHSGTSKDFIHGCISVNTFEFSFKWFGNLLVTSAYADQSSSKGTSGVGIGCWEGASAPLPSPYPQCRALFDLYGCESCILNRDRWVHFIANKRLYWLSIINKWCSKFHFVKFVQVYKLEFRLIETVPISQPFSIFTCNMRERNTKYQGIKWILQT